MCFAHLEETWGVKINFYDSVKLREVVNDVFSPAEKPVGFATVKRRTKGKIQHKTEWRESALLIARSSSLFHRGRVTVIFWPCVENIARAWFTHSRGEKAGLPTDFCWGLYFEASAAHPRLGPNNLTLWRPQSFIYINTLRIPFLGPPFVLLVGLTNAFGIWTITTPADSLLITSTTTTTTTLLVAYI